MSGGAGTTHRVHLPRRRVVGKRRFSVYWAWNYPWEANRDVAELDNRFSTMTEVRRAAWPAYEGSAYSAKMFLQGIAGTLELFHLSLLQFQQLVEEVTGVPVAVYQRVDQAGVTQRLDAPLLDDTDTLMVFGLDHLVTEQCAEPAEVEALEGFLRRDGACLLLAPHHDVGASSDRSVRAAEYAHHGDPLVPRQQRFGGYTRSLMRGLGVPVENRHGLRPATLPDTNRLRPLETCRDLDTRGWLTGVTTFNFHAHLPHYEVTAPAPRLQILARQPVDTSRPHPFVDAGYDALNAFLWMPPEGSRAGDILLADSTIFTTLFGVDESLRAFWRNLATR
jgi:hypothetical protein